MWNTIKTNKKKVVLIAIILVMAFLAYKYVSSGITIPQPSPSVTPASFSEGSSAEKMVVSGILVTNVYKRELSTNTRGDVLFSQNGDYQIIYFAKEERFLISIIGSPFDQKRTLAEQNFLKTLAVSEEEACKLQTIITTPSFANPGQSGINYKLSFCDK